MPFKTAHLIRIQRCSGPDAQQLASLLAAWRQRRSGDEAERAVLYALPEKPTTQELMLLRTTPEAATQLAQEVSRAFPGQPVSLHYRVNIIWIPRKSAAGTAEPEAERMHLITVHAETRALLAALDRHPAWLTGLAPSVQTHPPYTRLIVPAVTPHARVELLAGTLGEQLAQADAEYDVPGDWVTNGSLHHDFRRYRHGKVLPSQLDAVWP